MEKVTGLQPVRRWVKTSLREALCIHLQVVIVARLELARLRLRTELLGPLCIHDQVGGPVGSRILKASLQGRLAARSTSPSLVPPRGLESRP